jgi:protease I
MNQEGISHQLIYNSHPIRSDGAVSIYLYTEMCIPVIMKVLIVVAPEKFRDEELAGPVSAFQQQGIVFDIASVRRGQCTGMLGARINATISLEEVEPAAYDGIVIVGGAGSPSYLWNDDLLVRLVKMFYGAGKVTAAICLSPVVLARAGILKGKRTTYFESPSSDREMKKSGALLEKTPVVTDGRIVTGNGPAASKEFAEAVVHALTSPSW